MNKIFALNGEAEVLREFDTNAIEVDHVPVIQLVVQPQHLVAFTDQASPGAEKFRVLALRLRNFQKRQQLKKLLVVLAAHREQIEQQLADLQATLDEVRVQEKDARRLLAEEEHYFLAEAVARRRG